jgi:hypothetical protein
MAMFMSAMYAVNWVAATRGVVTSMNSAARMP